MEQQRGIPNVIQEKYRRKATRNKPANKIIFVKLVRSVCLQIPK